MSRIRVAFKGSDPVFARVESGSTPPGSAISSYEEDILFVQKSVRVKFSLFVRFNRISVYYFCITNMK